MASRRSAAQAEVDEDAPTREFVRPTAAVGVLPSQARRFAQTLAPFLAEELGLTVPRGAAFLPLTFLGAEERR